MLCNLLIRRKMQFYYTRSAIKMYYQVSEFSGKITEIRLKKVNLNEALYIKFAEFLPRMLFLKQKLNYGTYTPKFY